MKKVLVTGGAGFIGTNLITKLIPKKLDIISLDNYSIMKQNLHYQK